MNKLFRLERKHVKNNLGDTKVEQLLCIYKNKRRVGTWEADFEVSVNISFLQPCLMCACFKTCSDGKDSLFLHPKCMESFKGNQST